MSEQVTTPAPVTPLLLANLIKTSPKTAWVEFKEGISFELAYVSKSKFKSITDQCTHLQFDPRSKVHQPKVDTNKMVELFIKEAVRGWKGATPQRLALIAPIDLTNVPIWQQEVELEYSYDQLVALVKETYELDGFLQEAAMDIRSFGGATLVTKEDATKN